MKPKKSARFILIFFCVLTAFSTVCADNRTDKIDRIFAFCDKPDSPGCALAVIKDGKIIYKRGYGMADLENNVPITPRSVFYIGSLSKQFVTMCVALLVHEGKLSLDDDIRKYVPELPDYGTPITIQHLIYHTSGIRDYLTLEDIAGIPIGFYHEEDVLGLISRQKELNFHPGEEYLYSNSGYFLLSVIIHRASGKTLRQYAREHIFDPLGMKNSRFQDNYQELILNRTSGYLSEGGGKFKNFITTFDCVGSGGLFTSVEDLYLWDQNFYHHRVGGKEVFDLMHTVGTLNDGIKLDYAFAIEIKSYKGIKTVSHGGALGGYKSALIRFPEHNFSVICLSNLNSIDPSSLSYRVADVCLSEYFLEEKERPDRFQVVKLPKTALIDKRGSYIRFETGERIRVSFKEEKLFITFGNRDYPLAPISELEFIVQNTPRRLSVRFERQKSDKPLLLHIDEAGKRPRTFTSYRVDVPSKKQLSEYQGHFYSEELRITFDIRLEEDGLRFTHKKALQTPFKLLFKDFFKVGSLRIRFVRNEENVITGFLLDAGRVRNLRFTKRP